MDEKFNERLKQRQRVDQHALSLLLETAIDNNGLSKVLELIANICNEKAEHILCNWHDCQDELIAKAWEKQAKQIMKIEVTT